MTGPRVTNILLGVIALLSVLNLVKTNTLESNVYEVSRQVEQVKIYQELESSQITANLRVLELQLISIEGYARSAAIH